MNRADDFENWLMEYHSENNPEILDDMLPDCFNDWVCDLDSDEWIRLGNLYAKRSEEKRLKELKKEIERYSSRDGNANIELCYNDGKNPFAREELKHIDFSVSENSYVVESKMVNSFEARLKPLREIYEKFKNNDFPITYETLHQMWQAIKQSLGV